MPHPRLKSSRQETFEERRWRLSLRARESDEAEPFSACAGISDHPHHGEGNDNNENQ